MVQIKEIGIIGLGRFGTLLAKILKEDFKVSAYDPYTHSEEIEMKPLEYVASRDVIIYCVPIVKLEESLKETHSYIKTDAHILDVLSVKEYAYNTMKKLLPTTVSILPTHPMFGPDSIKKGRKGLPFVICKEKRTDEKTFNFFTEYFRKKTFKVIETTCIEHDKTTAKSLCLTQLIGRMVIDLDLRESDYDTTHYRNLIEMSKTASNDSIELFTGLQEHNLYAEEMRKQLLDSLNNLYKVIKA